VLRDGSFKTEKAELEHMETTKRQPVITTWWKGYCIIAIWVDVVERTIKVEKRRVDGGGATTCQIIFQEHHIAIIVR
jgi:hypothetical protein